MRKRGSQGRTEKSVGRPRSMVNASSDIAGPASDTISRIGEDGGRFYVPRWPYSDLEDAAANSARWSPLIAAVP